MLESVGSFSGSLRYNIDSQMEEVFLTTNNVARVSIQSLQEESIRKLYQMRLQEYLASSPTADNVEEGWNSINICIQRATFEAYNRYFTQKFRNKKVFLKKIG